MKILATTFVALSIIGVIIWSSIAVRARQENVKADALTAERAFWEIFQQNKFYDIPAVLTTSRRALARVESQKEVAQQNLVQLNSRIAFLYLWRFFESPLHGEARQPADIQKAMAFFRTAEAHLGYVDASMGQHLPADCKGNVASAPATITGFLAVSTLAYGRATGNPQYIQEGKQLVQEKALHCYPWFTTFTIAAANRPLIRMDNVTIPQAEKMTLLKQTLHGLWSVVGMCAALEREGSAYQFHAAIEQYRPFIDAWGIEPIPTDGYFASEQDRIWESCINSDMAPHNYETTFLYLGDVMALCQMNATAGCNWPFERGNEPPAETLWQMATLSPTYYEWPYRNALQTRLDGFSSGAEDSSGAAAAFAPATGYPGCTVCHQKD